MLGYSPAKSREKKQENMFSQFSLHLSSLSLREFQQECHSMDTVSNSKHVVVFFFSCIFGELSTSQWRTNLQTHQIGELPM